MRAEQLFGRGFDATILAKGRAVPVSTRQIGPALNTPVCSPVNLTSASVAWSSSAAKKAGAAEHGLAFPAGVRNGGRWPLVPIREGDGRVRLTTG
jgi:hypothetical protein